VEGIAEPFDGEQRSHNWSPLDNPRILSGPFWGELRVFLAVAKAKSYNRAARELNISQPTIARQVKRLQDVIGSQLVVSTPKGIALTDTGKELAVSLLALDEKLFDIARSLRAGAREAEGVVRVSVTEGLAGQCIAPKLAEFCQLYPKIQLHLCRPNTLQIYGENMTDIAVGFSPTVETGMVSRALGYVHLSPFVSSNYITSYGMPTSGNLEDHRFVDCEYFATNTVHWSSWRAAVSRGASVHYCNLPDTYGRLVNAGIGIGLAGNFMLTDDASIPIDIGVAVKLPIHITSAAEQLSAQRVRLVYDWLSAIFSPTTLWFAPDFSWQSLPWSVFEQTRGYLTENSAEWRLDFLPK
jgi:DNA-binding transcriptional LysR family regulator